MTTFPQRYVTVAQKIGRDVSTLWLHNKLTKRRVRRVIRNALGESVQITNGAFRVTAVLPNGVIKVPYTESAIKSTFIEATLFREVRRNPTIRRHFPKSQLVQTQGIPVLIQELVERIGDSISDAAEDAVIEFGLKLGVGDLHRHNYGWKRDRIGLYPVFVDCETSNNGGDLDAHTVPKIASRQSYWTYSL